MLAGFLCAQLESRDRVQARRRAIWEGYFRELREWADAEGVRLPVVPAHCEQAYHMFYLLLPSSEARGALIEHLRQRGIMGVSHYQPLHTSVMGRRFGGRAGDCPVTEDVAGRVLRLPFHNSLSDETLARVTRAVQAFRCGVAA
jgi:dTDP-4-amino-4,6-dideoxygalactose transaminase